MNHAARSLVRDRAVAKVDVGTAYRIRTGDLRLERAVSWASRRMRPRGNDPHGVACRRTGYQRPSAATIVAKVRVTSRVLWDLDPRGSGIGAPRECARAGVSAGGAVPGVQAWRVSHRAGTADRGSGRAGRVSHRADHGSASSHRVGQRAATRPWGHRIGSPAPVGWDNGRRSGPAGTASGRLLPSGGTTGGHPALEVREAPRTPALRRGRGPNPTADASPGRRGCPRRPAGGCARRRPGRNASALRTARTPPRASRRGVPHRPG